MSKEVKALRARVAELEAQLAARPQVGRPARKTPEIEKYLADALPLTVAEVMQEAGKRGWSEALVRKVARGMNVVRCGRRWTKG